MFTAFFRSWLQSKRRPSAFRHQVRPSLEHLEDRCVPAYLQTNLVSDVAGMAAHTDPHLLNPWGISVSLKGPFWISDNGSGLSTLYDGTGTVQSLVVAIPTPPGGTPPAAPTGTVFNGTTDFVIGAGGSSGPAAFLFDTEDGTISGWNPTADPTHAILEVDNSKVGAGAVYKGLALGSNATNGNLLFATNFRAGTVDVFDKNFKAVNLGANAFKDPNLTAGFAPFGISNIGGSIYVTYAKQDAAKHDDVGGVGNGFVDLFDTSGTLVRRVTSGGALNSPWGLALAPADFGTFSNDLLVGNFGDGLINAFDPTTGAALGSMLDINGKAVRIDGLWGLNFGNNASAGPTNTLYFTAGPNGEKDGLFGSLQSAAPLNSAKLGAYRPSDGSWSLDSNDILKFDSNLSQVFLHFSPPNVTGVAGDWTGSGHSNIGDFNAGVWHLDLAGTGAKPGASETFQFGQAGDQPVVGDWDGNPSGRSELGVFRTAPDGISGQFILDANNDRQIGTGDTTFTFGLATDHIVVGDWNGSGTTKVGVYRDAKNFIAADAGDIVFSINQNGSTDASGNPVFTNFVFGLITDKVVIGDWTGDGKAKVGVYRDGSTAPVGNTLFAPGTALFSLDSGALMFNAQSKVFLYGLTSDQFVSGNWPPTPPLLSADTNLKNF